MKTLIIIVTIAALAAVAGSVVVGIKSFDGTVTDRPYENGLLWDKVRNEKATLGWSAVIQNRRLRMGGNELLISVTNKDGTPLLNFNVDVLRSRPSSSDYDRHLRAVKLADGFYRVPVRFPLYGYWDLKINVRQGQRRVLFEERVFVEKKGMQQGHASGGSADTLTDCAINAGPCAKEIGTEKIQVVFDIISKPVTSMKRLLFSVDLMEPDEPVTDADLTVVLTMPGMFMGVNRLALKQMENGRYEGKGIIPICPSGKKIWMADIGIKSKDKISSVSYRFEVN